jgi:transcription factor SFP1
VKLDSHETSPPPLSHSPRESTAASTPISTPVEQPASPHFGRPADASANAFYSWHRKPHQLVARQLPDTELLFEDAGDCSFPLFPASPQRQHQQHSGVHAMAQTASPIDIQPPSR